MSQDSESEIWVLDSDDEHEAADSIEDEGIALPDGDDPDDLEIVAIRGITRQPSTAEATGSSRGSKRVQKVIRNGPILPPYAEVETYQLTYRVGDTVELKDTKQHSGNGLQSGDFLYIKHVIKNLATDEVKLRGYRLRRTKYHGQIFDWKTNELVMVLNVHDDDNRSPFVQGMEDVGVTDVLKRRQCTLTSKEYPLGSFRDDPLPNNWDAMTTAEIKPWVFRRARVACRWINIVVQSENGKQYSGVVRRLYSHECEAEQPSVSPAVLRLDLSRESSVAIGDEEDDSDFVIVERPESRRILPAAKRRQRPESVVEQDASPPKRTLPTKDKRYTFGDSFCGAGGASQGAVQAGLFVKWGLDHNKYAMQAYEANHLLAWVYEMDAHDFPEIESIKALRVDVLHLSPPCCFWSPAHTHEGKNDQANYEAIYTVGPILQKLKPRIATLEQTYGLATSREHKKNFKLLMNDITKAGYDLRWKIEDLSRFGLAQQRKRLLIIAARRGTPLPPFPEPTHGPEGSGLKRFVSVYDALEPLRRTHPNNVDELHKPTPLRNPKEPYDARNSFLKGCITTSGGENYHWSGTRNFTIRELALLQSFPYVYDFKGKKGEMVKQIGNAFPPIMAEQMYRSIVRTLEAFDGGYIGAEDDLSDLDGLYSRHGLGTPDQEQSLTKSPFKNSSQGSVFGRSSKQNSVPDTPVKKKKRTLFGHGTDIEPVRPKNEKKLRPSISSLWGEERKRSVSMPFRPRKRQDSLTDEEKFALAEATGDMIEID
ncbi:S-adenosyl-L-methionine-dependent methyltransferase [Lophiotrema nucula]|uniref:DNA (cytosine-5-)-methyltransferase n=1 Tax=Lophiotrema nucula TaxID=690887 RepID=A0A6A5ZEH5_9PLEO|nr:S-adenosyl-L-methionine-dependent methyltransferase [Lophiotrema nucula]